MSMISVDPSARPEAMAAIGVLGGDASEYEELRERHARYHARSQGGGSGGGSGVGSMEFGSTTKFDLGGWFRCVVFFFFFLVLLRLPPVPAFSHLCHLCLLRLNQRPALHSGNHGV